VRERPTCSHQKARAAGEPDIDLRHGEIGVVGCDHDVAGEHQHEARADCRPVHGGDDRLGAVRHRVEELAHQAIVTGIVARFVHQVDPLLEVGAGGKRVAGRRQDGDADVVAIADRVEDGDQLLARAPVLGVHGRTIEGDRGDAVGDIEVELLEIHGVS
jgi:hypothetical protein